MKSILVRALLIAGVTQTTDVRINGQSRTIPGEAVTITATVEAIDTTTRTLTVKGPQGSYVAITAPASVERFSDIKVGDVITARYYDNVVIRKKPTGEPAVDSTSDAMTKGVGARPVATAAAQRTVTASIVAIDRSVPSITFKGEKVNWTYSSRVADKAALATVDVGDRVDITWTEAVTLSVTPAKKS
jgi:hypothetical protein